MSKEWNSGNFGSKSTLKFKNSQLSNISILESCLIPPTLLVGIDLGTTCCCVGIWRNDRVEIIPNDQGNRTTPSYVAFTDTGRLIGDAAKSQIASNTRNTVFASKRLIGRPFNDPEVQSDIKVCLL